VVASVTTTLTTIIANTFNRKRSEATKLDHRLPLSLAARQQTVMPSNVPIYASACSGTVRYSSACSCLGLTKSTITVAAPTTVVPSTSTVTVTPTNTQNMTVTSTTTIDATATVGCNTYYLQAQGSSVDAQYVVLPGSDDETITQFTSNINGAAIFTLDSSGNLFNSQYRADTDPFSPATIYFDRPGDFSGAPALNCTIAGALNCTGYTAAATIFQLCPADCSTGGELCGGVALGTSVDSRCQSLSFNAIPACT